MESKAETIRIDARLRGEGTDRPEDRAWAAFLASSKSSVADLEASTRRAEADARRSEVLRGHEPFQNTL